MVQKCSSSSLDWYRKIFARNPWDFTIKKVGFLANVPLNQSLVGGWATPLKNMNVNWDDDYSQLIWENKIHGNQSPPTRSPQPVCSSTPHLGQLLNLIAFICQQALLHSTCRDRRFGRCKLLAVPTPTFHVVSPQTDFFGGNLSEDCDSSPISIISCNYGPCNILSHLGICCNCMEVSYI